MQTSDSAGKPSKKGSGLYDRLVDSWTRTSFAHPWRVLLAVLAVAAGAAPFAASLKIDTDMKKLLPRSYPTVRQMDVAIKKVGDLGYFSLVIENENREESLRFAQAFAKKIEGSPYVRTVLFENPTEFLKQYRFVLTPLEDLGRIRREVLKARRKRSPLSLNLEQDGEANSQKPPVPEPQGASEGLETLKKNYTRLNNMRRYHFSEDGRIMAMQIRPRKGVTNLAFVKRMHNYLLDEATALKKNGFSQDMNLHVSGSLKNKLDEYDIIIGDILRSAWSSGLLILVMLVAFFRRPTILALVLAPLAIGLIWTFAVAQMAIGFLNTISAMLFVVLFGLGIDHGIHLMKRLQREVESKEDTLDAVTATLRQTGKAVWVSALTTAGGFLLMLIVDFRGFSQLGFIAGVSMLLITGAYFLGLPALTCVFNRRGLFRKKASQSHNGGRWHRFFQAYGRLPSHVGAFALLGLVAIGVASALRLSFNYDFTTLQGTNVASEAIKKKQAKVYTESLTPGAVVFAPDDTSLDAIIAELKTRRQSDTESPTIDKVISLRTFVPTDQEKRLEVIRDTARLITPMVLKKTEDRTLRKILKDLKRSAKLEPIGMKDVSPEILDFFTPQDGSQSRMIFIFPSIERKHGLSAIAFADDMGPIEVGKESYLITGDMLIFAEILRLVVDQGLMLFGLSLLVIAGLVLWQFKQKASAGLALLALAGGLGLMAVILDVFGVDINLYNMVIFSAVVGMGIDSSIHLTSHWIEARAANDTSDSPALTAARSVGGAVSASALTTVAGYVGMILSNHPGLRSIGILAVIGLVSCWIVTLFLLPIFLKRFDNAPVIASPSHAS